MNSIIFQNNIATEDIFTFHILPYFNFISLREFSKINLSSEKYSYETYIDNISSSLTSDNFYKFHENIVGCFTNGNYRHCIVPHLRKPLLLQRIKTNFIGNEDIVKLPNLKYLVTRCKLPINFFHNLEHLELQTHMLNVGCGDGIGTLTKLKFLKISEYSLDTFTDENLKNLINLEYLYIEGHYPCIFNITDESIKTLVNLKSLELKDFNNITDESIKKLKKLEHLYVSHCDNINDESIQYLINLNYLHMHVNNFTEIITEKSIEKLTKLKYIWLDEFKFTVSLLNKLPNLETIGTYYGDEKIYEYISQSSTIKNLILYFSTHDDSSLEKMINLESLELHQCVKVTGTCFQKMINLASLSLSRCTSITYENLENLVKFMKLTNLEFCVHSFTRESLQALKKLNPELDIDFFDD